MKTKRTAYFYLFLSILLTSILFSCTNDKKSDPSSAIPPNVILVITDDQGYGDVGAHGNPIIQTPALDAFHKESVRFTDFHVSPTCAPTRAALMTGRYTNRTAAWHTIAGWSFLRENEKTLADMFTEGGYVTGAFGKWHLGDNYPFRPFERGFQHTVMHGGGGVQQTPDYWNNDYFDDTYFKNGQPQAYKGYCTDVFFEEAISFIETQREKPFFCYISTNAPHGPYNVPPAYEEMYKDYDELLDVQKKFYGMITNIDDNFGKLRKKLEELKIADNTLLIFMTDNGTAAGSRKKDGTTHGFNSGMRGTKGSQYEGGHRVPFFIYWKNGKILGGKDVNELTAHIDVMPTLAELCGLSLPKNHLPIDGKSLVPLLKGKTFTEKDRMLITDSQRIQVPKKWKSSSVMSTQWRLINGKELYDIKSDPGQTTDLAAENSEQVAAMRSFYEGWWESMLPTFDDIPHIKVGSENENPVALTAHDWHADNGEHPWHQLYIRRGFKGKSGKSNGFWSIEVVEGGDYEISLRRYPIESGLAINATTPGISVEELPGLGKEIPAGQDLNFVSGNIQLGDDINAKETIEAGAESVNFTLNLAAGKTTLTAAFTDIEGAEMGAYYAYVRKL